MPQTIAKQDETITAITETKPEQLEARQEDMVKSDPTDNLDEDYQPIPHLPPHAHDREVGGSSSAPP